MTAEMWTIIIGALVPVTAFASWAADRWWKKRNSVQDSNVSAMTAVTNASEKIVAMLTENLEAMQIQLDAQEEEIQLNKEHMQRLDHRMLSLVMYTKQLRAQLQRLGHTPLPFPPEIEDQF